MNADRYRFHRDTFYYLDKSAKHTAFEQNQSIIAHVSKRLFSKVQ